MSDGESSYYKPVQRRTSDSSDSIPSSFPMSESLFNDYSSSIGNITPNLHFATQDVLPPEDYQSPYYIPFKNSDEPRPVDQLIYRFTIWKMIIKQIVFYFKEMSIFKKQTYLGNKAMLENLEVLKRQNSGKLKVKANSNKSLKKSLSTSDFLELQDESSGGNSNNNGVSNNAFNQESVINKLLQTSFLPPGDHSILSISTTFFNTHSIQAEKELITFNQLTLKLIPRLENLKDSLNETIRQMSTIKNSPDYKTKDLKIEIAKTGGVLSDYITNIELLKNGESKTSLGTVIKLKDNDNIEPKDDPYLLRLKLDLQLKDQLYVEAHLKEMYYDLQRKSVQLETILYKEIQNCISVYSNLINNELDSIKDNLVSSFMEGFVKNDQLVDWDYFIVNDDSNHFLNLTGKDTLMKVKQIRKKSDIIYPYQNDSISSCILSGFLERKSKYLKTYSKLYYVLTLNFLHEFKSDDRKKDRHPVNSYSLNDVKVATSQDDPKKFILRIISRKDDEISKTKYTFRCPNESITVKWVECLADLCSFTSSIERNTSFDDDDDGEDTENNNSNMNQDNYKSNDNTTLPTMSPSENEMEQHLKSVSLDNASINSSVISPQLKPMASPSSSSSMLFSLPAFRSIKPNQMVPSSSLTARLPSRPSSRASSRSSSRASSRASSPIRVSSRTNLVSPRATSVSSPTAINTNSGVGTLAGSGGGSGSGSGSGGDYFSYAPRKATRNARLSGINTGRTTPGSGSSLPESSITNLATAKGASTSNTAPLISVQASSPITTVPPPNILSIDSIHDNTPIDSGLQGRKQTLSEKFHSNVGAKEGQVLLNMPEDKVMLNSGSGLPQTPGIIPGGKLGSIFKQNQLSQQLQQHLSQQQYQQSNKQQQQQQQQQQQK